MNYFNSERSLSTGKYFSGAISLVAKCGGIILFYSQLILHPVTAQTISTFAGTGTAGYNGDGISAASAQIYYPHNIAVDASGNIFFPDYGNNRIRKISVNTGLISTVAGTGTAGYNGDGIAAISAQISQPTSLTFDSQGNLYFTDRGNQRVRSVNISTGIISTVAGTGTPGYNGDSIAATTAQLNGPNEVAFDTADNLFIADWFNQRVRKVSKATGLITSIAGTGTAGYNGDGIAATAAQIDGPCGIIFDRAGNIYIAAYTGHRIRKITIANGIISTIAGTGTGGYNGDGIAATTAQLYQPAYISFDASENLYIGDDANYRIRKIDKITGLISTVAGTGAAGYNSDGIAPTAAQVNHAYHPYFNRNDCTMLIADTYNHRIRKITGAFSGCVQAVAPGNKISCQTLPAITIDNSNNNVWVSVYDTAGRIAAQINGNGNNLGVVNTTLFTKSGNCREDLSKRLYLNRNITISVQTQPSSPVGLRLYILKSELDSLKTATNSQNQPSGVASINEVDVFKNNDGCSTTGSAIASPLSATSSVYNTNDYYLEVSVSSFSSFYFANKSLPQILPVKLRSFNGKTTGGINQLSWQADCVPELDFIIERSADGSIFQSIGSVHSLNCNQLFSFADNHPLANKNFYRLQIKQPGLTIQYSPVIALDAAGNRSLQISTITTLVSNGALIMQTNSSNSKAVKMVLVDMTGRMMQQQHISLQSGSNLLFTDVSSLSPGVYCCYISSGAERSNTVRFIKQ